MDFAGPDATARTLPKHLRYVHVSARPPAYAGYASVDLGWAADDISNMPSSGTNLIFARFHRPEAGLLRHRTLDVAASDLNGGNSGRRFHFRLAPASPAIIEALNIDARVRDADWPTNYS